MLHNTNALDGKEDGTMCENDDAGTNSKVRYDNGSDESFSEHSTDTNINIHWCAKVKDEVEKLAYQLNEEAERTERPIRRLSKVMYGSTCADMQVDVMGECLSSIQHVVGTTSGCFYPRSNHWEVGGRPQCDKCGRRVRIAHSIVSRLRRQFQTTGTAIRGSVVVIHEEPHPQMTGTLSYRPEETGGRQREKSLDTRHRRLKDRYRVLPWPEDCTVVVCLHDALYGVYL
ncbi:uncharacterized protein TNCV_3094831 [Trichonephila clavipes]|nr:uncharacterized protein TNCV_3094831 [Trichonephila clavipes]